MSANPARRPGMNGTPGTNGTHGKLAPLDLPAIHRSLPVSEPNGASIEKATRDLLIAVGEDPTRDGLIDTPARVSKSMQQLTEGYRMSPQDVVGDALFDVEYDEMV